jgi:hypothetical protein
MTRAEASKHLDAVREGRFVPKHRIRNALRLTGDLPPISKAICRRVSNFGTPQPRSYS